jgi:hypothetical protein
MKGLVCAAALWALVAAIAAGASASAGASPSDDKPVHAKGCVQAGVENGCLVVQDKATGDLYNLLINGAKPAVGIGIDFNGTRNRGATTCMQGTTIQVASWTRNDTLKCTRSKGGSVQ